MYLLLSQNKHFKQRQRLALQPFPEFGLIQSATLTVEYTMMRALFSMLYMDQLCLDIKKKITPKKIEKTYI